MESYLLFLFLLLLVLSALFSGSETALFSLKRSTIEKFKHHEKGRFRFIEQLLHAPNDLLISILIGNMLVNVLISTFSDSLFSPILNQPFFQNIRYSKEVVTILISFFILVLFGEILPKLYAYSHAERVTTQISPFLFQFLKIVRPIQRFLKSIAYLILGLKGNDTRKTEIITKDELQYAIAIGKEQGIIAYDEMELLENVFFFSKLEARNIIIPRKELFCLDKNQSIDIILYEVRRHRFSHIPIYDTDVDHIVGILPKNKLVELHFNNLTGSKDNKSENILDYAEEPYFLPENKPLTQLLSTMKNKNIKMAIVLDEHGGTKGAVSIDDCLREILGEFSDEDDIEIGREIQLLEDGRFLIDSAVSPHDFTKETSIELDAYENDTIAGYIMMKMDKLPEKGEVYVENGWQFKIVSADETSIQKILVEQDGQIAQKPFEKDMPE